MPISWIFGERCVRCGVTRTKEEFEGLPTCDKCELEIKSEREDKRPCPACKTAMNKSVVLNVIVDKCPACHGAWLDGGELDLLKQAIEAGATGNFATGLCLGMAIG
jgi:hypothetical protein